jgi:hypothetical protein
MFKNTFDSRHHLPVRATHHSNDRAPSLLGEGFLDLGAEVRGEEERHTTARMERRRAVRKSGTRRPWNVCGVALQPHMASQHGRGEEARRGGRAAAEGRRNPFLIRKMGLAGACSTVCGGAADKILHVMGSRAEDEVDPGRWSCGVRRPLRSTGDCDGRKWAFGDGDGRTGILR